MFFWVRAFLAKLPKKGNFGPPPKKKILADSRKAHFGVFGVFSLLLSFLFFFEGLRVRSKGPPHLALNPP